MLLRGDQQERSEGLKYPSRKRIPINIDVLNQTAAQGCLQKSAETRLKQKWARKNDIDFLWSHRIL